MQVDTRGLRVFMTQRHTAISTLIIGGFGWLMSLGFVMTAHAAELVPRKLDGVMVQAGKENPWPVAMMIDEHTSARPESSLQAASIVYETLAEGGIPRFMAVYADAASLPTVGPVRSTRPYFVRYAAELNAVLIHAGGSPDALQLVKKLRLQSFMGISGTYAKYFFRAFGGGVHGLYTNGKNVFAALKQAGTTKLKALYRPWLFVDGPAKADRLAGKHGAVIDLGYGSAYIAEYRYDLNRDAYARSTGGRALIDRVTNRQIMVRNVVILNVPAAKVLDRKGRLDINVIGKGTGVLLRGGQVEKIIWSKKNDRGRTMFVDAATKEEVALTRGNTWVEVVPKGRTYKAY